MTQSPPTLDLRDPALYAFWKEDLIRFADLDRYNHLNNVAFAMFYEGGRIALMEHVRPGSVDGVGSGWLIARLAVNFLAAARYPGDVRIGTLVTHLGNSSVGLGQALYTNGTCFSTAESVVVWADLDTERSRPLPDDLRRDLSVYMPDALSPG